MTIDNQKTILKKPHYLRRPALFLDRDGVIIEDRNYIKDPKEVSLCDGVIQLISIANKNGWPVIIITNQSGISRGFSTWEDYKKVTMRMIHLLGEEAKLSAIYANSCGANASLKSWRKPSPEMLLDASESLNLDLNNSVLVGDRLSDLLAGESAGIKSLCHVLTGHGIEERTSIINRFNSSSQLKKEVLDNTIYELILINCLTEFPYELISKLNI